MIFFRTPSGARCGGRQAAPPAAPGHGHITPGCRHIRKILVFAVLVTAAGCSTYTSKMEISRDFYYAGEYEQAIGSLTALIKDASDNDVCLYLLERGKTRLAWGDYDSAIVDFQEAEKRVHEIEGTFSVSEFIKTSLVSAGKMEYQPESHEKILINAYLLLAYQMKGDFEGAKVERNRTVARLEQYTDALSQEDWEKLDVPFARYLAALLYEMEGLTDDARIEYDEVAKLRPEARPASENPNLTEVVVFAEMGRAPLKISREVKGYFNDTDGNLFGFFTLPGASEPMMVSGGAVSGLSMKNSGVVFSFAFPEYVRQPRIASSCRVVIDSLEAAPVKALDNIEETAMESFKKRIGMILLKSALRTYLRTLAQTKLDDKAGGLIDILGKFYSAVETADTRSWQTLPAEIGVFRMECPPGEHEVFLNYYDEGGVPAGCSRKVRFTVVEGKKEIIYFPGPS
ncbi:MAG: hypothetical protein MUF59_10625 [Candidatus Krumholzibacteria bacterium]|jgi:hypothetical protein|nr:hypothetical protein [Candidatus Krumholzibacteria bacterium]